jgi:hypothetical protein
MKRFKCIFLDGVAQETRLQYSQLAIYAERIH